jgi:hypothetical protein
MDTEIILRIAFATVFLAGGLALLVYNVRRKMRRMKSQLRHADLRRRALHAAERS